MEHTDHDPTSCLPFHCTTSTSDYRTKLNSGEARHHRQIMSSLPGGQLTLLEPLGDLARGQPSPIEPGGLAGEVLLFIKS